MSNGLKKQWQEPILDQLSIRMTAAGNGHGNNNGVGHDDHGNGNGYGHDKHDDLGS